MSKKCLDNHGKCKVICCRYYPVSFPSDLSKHLDLYKVRGFKMATVRVDGERRNVMIVPSVCPALTKDNRCSLWGTSKIPKICKEGYNKNKDVVFPENCVYCEK